MSDEVTIPSAEDPPKEAVVYIGPTSAKLGLTRLSVYSGIHDLAQKAMDESPALRALFVPLGEFPAMRSQVFNNEGSFSHIVQHLTEAGIF